MISLLIGTVAGIALGVIYCGVRTRERAMDGRSVRVNVHEMEAMVEALTRCRYALASAIVENKDVQCEKELRRAYSATLAALGETNGHAPTEEPVGRKGKDFWT